MPHWGLPSLIHWTTLKHLVFHNEFFVTTKKNPFRILCSYNYVFCTIIMNYYPGDHQCIHCNIFIDGKAHYMQWWRVWLMLPVSLILRLFLTIRFWTIACLCCQVLHIAIQHIIHVFFIDSRRLTSVAWCWYKVSGVATTRSEASSRSLGEVSREIIHFYD